MSANHTWLSVLEELETRVTEAEAALDSGAEIDESLVAPFEAPTDLPPLPEALFGRAVEVMRKQAELEQRLITTRDAIGRELKTMVESTRGGSSPFSDSAAPKYVDRSV